MCAKHGKPQNQNDIVWVFFFVFLSFFSFSILLWFSGILTRPPVFNFYVITWEFRPSRFALMEIQIQIHSLQSVETRADLYIVDARPYTHCTPAVGYVLCRRAHCRRLWTMALVGMAVATAATAHKSYEHTNTITHTQHTLQMSATEDWMVYTIYVKRKRVRGHSCNFLNSFSLIVSEWFAFDLTVTKENNNNNNNHNKTKSMQWLWCRLNGALPHSPALHAHDLLVLRCRWLLSIYFHL